MPEDTTSSDPPSNPGNGVGRAGAAMRRLNPGWIGFAGTTWLAVLVTCSLGLVALMAVPKPTPSAPSGTLVVASVPFWHFRDGTRTVVEHQAAINEVSPWIYGINESGRLTTQYPPEQSRAVSDNLDRLREAGVPIMPSLANITNGAWSYGPVARMLHDPALRQQHVAEIVELVKRENYIGIDLDYEDLRSGDRAVFTAFVTELAAGLHAEGKLLSVALFAKTSDAGYDERNVAQDYAAIGRVADEVRLMAYDRHWSTSPPGPVAPIGWIREVLAYAKSQMPPDRIVLGIPLSGYDWSGGTAESVTWLQAFRLTGKHNLEPNYDARSQSPWFRYTDEEGNDHEVWFENAASSAAKFEAARGAGIRGVYLWMYGYEDTATWRKLRESLPVK